MVAGRSHRQVDWPALLADATIGQDGDALEVVLAAECGAELVFAYPSALPDARNRVKARLRDLLALDDEAFAFLSAQPGWAYGEDAVLWLVIEDRDTLRLCYQQERVNDEQVVGFERRGDGWALAGFDPRWRAF